MSKSATRIGSTKQLALLKVLVHLLKNLGQLVDKQIARMSLLILFHNIIAGVS